MGIFERYLSLWVGLCIVAGVALGSLFPGVFQVFASLEYASVNLPVAVLIWLMIYPMMVQVDFASIRDVGKRPSLGKNSSARGQMPAQGRLDYEYTNGGLFPGGDIENPAYHRSRHRTL